MGVQVRGDGQEVRRRSEGARGLPGRDRQHLSWPGQSHCAEQDSRTRGDVGQNLVKRLVAVLSFAHHHVHGTVGRSWRGSTLMLAADQRNGEGSGEGAATSTLSSFFT